MIGKQPEIVAKSRFSALFYAFLLSSFLMTACSNQTQNSPIGYVDVFIGTGGHGHTYPGATAPFGMIQPGPVNGTSGWDWVSGYHYSDSLITGFAQTHLSGTGIGDLNDILIQPVLGDFRLDAPQKQEGKRNYASTFSHQNEMAAPGFYKVQLEEAGIWAEMTATDRVALYRFSYPKGEEGALLIDLGFSLNWDQTDSSQIQVVDAQTLTGYRMSSGWARNQRVYFAMQCSSPFKISSAVIDSEIVSAQNTLQGKELLAKLNFDAESASVLCKIALSAVSEDGALKNLKTLSSWDFDQTKAETQKAWQSELGNITVEGDPETKTKFYTALYHTKLAPALFSDVDGSFRKGNGEVGRDTAQNRYTIFSLWDTFRAQHPLLTITDPERVNDFVQTLLGFYQETGYLPVWELHGNETNTMTGYHAIPVILDAYAKGFRGFNAELAFQAMKASAMQNQRDTDLYRKYGYVPSDLGVESVTKTLEYAYDDWCIAQMALLLEKKKEYRYFMEHSESWKQVFDKKTKFMRGKTAEGNWVAPFDPLRSTHRHSTDYTEGNAWQHTWFVPQDVRGLIDGMGGGEAFSARLDSMFNMSSKITGEDISPDISGMIGQYAHGNEPSHHIAYLYTYAGKPWKTQQRVHQIMDSLYTTHPDGLSGNEDEGQMSAWYVFSAMGLYPVNPASGVYVIGSPALSNIEIHLADGKIFTIKAKNRTQKNVYIQSAMLNGHKLSRSYLTHKEVMKGGTLEFEMGSQPNKNWAASINERPPHTFFVQ
jgi:predicted alpha-1,2-mannosidase